MKQVKHVCLLIKTKETYSITIQLIKCGFVIDAAHTNSLDYL